MTTKTGTSSLAGSPEFPSHLVSQVLTLLVWILTASQSGEGGLPSVRVTSQGELAYLLK